MPKSFLVRKKLPHHVKQWKDFGQPAAVISCGPGSPTGSEETTGVKVKTNLITNDDTPTVKSTFEETVKTAETDSDFTKPCSQTSPLCIQQPGKMYPLFFPFPYKPFCPAVMPEQAAFRRPLYCMPFAHPQSPPTPWLSSHPGKISPPIGVLSPAEIPSPTTSTVANEPCTSNGASMTESFSYMVPNRRFPITTIPNRKLHPYPPREYVPSPFPEQCKLNMEVVNGGYGVKNPMLTPDLAFTPRVDTSRAEFSQRYPETFFNCSVCGFRCDTKKLLQRHMKEHKEVKRFLCTFCGKGFNDTFDLKRHTRTHTGVRPYTCEICGKSFTQRCSLESHGKKIHGLKFMFGFNERRSKVYVCEDCGHSSGDPEVHYLHLRSSHPNNPAILKCHDRRQFKFGKQGHLTSAEKQPS